MHLGCVYFGNSVSCVGALLYMCLIVSLAVYQIFALLHFCRVYIKISPYVWVVSLVVFQIAA